MQRSAAQVGAVVPGWRDIRQLGRINVIQVTARDLFPQGCVTLAGIKPIKNAPIDLAIVYAASIMAEACPTLRDVFLNMLGDRSMIAKVDDREAVYGKGYIGWVNKRRVLVGNRSLMQDYGVKLPQPGVRAAPYRQPAPHDLPGRLRQTVCHVPGGLPA